MKLAYPDINKVFDTDIDKVNCIIIENSKLLYNLCMDIYAQINGDDGRATVSIDNKPVDIAKNVDLITDYIPFSINNKKLQSKLNASAEKIAISPEYYDQTVDELARLERYIIDIISEMNGDVIYNKLDVASLIKAAGLSFDEVYISLGEKIISYMELVRYYDRDKLFIYVNLRSYMEDKEYKLFLDTVLRKDFHVIMIDNKMYDMALAHINSDDTSNYELYIIDEELCEIS